MESNAAYRRTRLLLFLVISIGYLVVYFQRMAPAIVGPVMAEDLGLAASDLGLMASMYFWAQAAGCIPAGLLSDTYGPRKVIALGLICAAAGTVVFVLGDGIAVLAIGRFIIGLSVSVVFVGAVKIFADWFYPNELATCSGTLLSVGNIGALLSTMPLMWIIGQAGWRNTFWAVAAYTLFAGVMAWLMLRNKPEDCGYAPVRTDSQERVSIREALKVVFTTPRFYLINVAIALFYGPLMNVGGLWAGPYLQDVYGLSKTVTSSIVMCFTIGMIFSCPISGWLSDKVLRARKPVVMIGMLLNIIGYLPLVFWTDAITSTTMLHLLFGLLGFSGGFFVVGVACVKETVAPRYAATSVGGLNMGSALGAAFFQYVCGLIIDSYDKTGTAYSAEAYAGSFKFCLVMVLISVVCLFFFKERRQ